MSGEPRPAMTADRWRRVGRLFDQALAIAPDRRAGFLARCAEEDPALAEEVASLLAADETAGELIDALGAELAEAPAGEVDEEEPPELTGVRLGKYRLLREIGRGGMSRVFLAERVGDHLRRRVAIKRLTSPGWQRAERLRRFEAEGRVLASLSHPGIAQVYDAGIDELGDPYLVIEYVQGEPITDWCARARPPLAGLLARFLDVCAAVHHAHQRGIVHRDLKPSNILVDGEGRVKLLDFGIAKLLDPERQGLGGEVPPTRAGLLPMTPEYAAPEQFRGEAVTTATDVWGLGLLLYELLTGRRAFELAGRSPLEISDVLCHRDPRRPSTAARAAGAGTAAPEVRPALAGAGGALAADLDAVVLRALAKEPDRRYGSARELADDVERCLAGEPVVARPEGLGGRLGRSMRRHRRAVAGLAASVLLLVALGVFHAYRLHRERDVARHQARRAEQVTEVLSDVLAAADPRSGVAPATVDDLLARGVERARRLEGEPAIRAELLHVLALAYFGRGALGEAEPLFEEALELARRHFPAGDPRRVRGLNHLGWLRVARGDFASGRALFEEAVELQETRSPASEDLAHSLRGLALAASGGGDHAGAEALLRRALSILVARLGPGHPHVADARQDLGIVLRDRRMYAEARRALEESLAARLRRFGPRHVTVGQSLLQLGLVSRDVGDPATARELLERSLAIHRDALGPDHPTTAGVRRQLAELVPPPG